MIRPSLFFTLIASVTISGTFAQEKTEPVVPDPQTAVTFEKKVEKPLSLKYLLSLPEGFDAGDKAKKWPLIVFLHGAGERGDNLEKVKVHGPPKLVAAGQKFPFVLVSPQCPENGWWTTEPVLELIDDLETRYNIDPDRIYLTGLSMGGYGTWHFASMAPERFAAIAPVCGGGIPYFMRKLKEVPVWAFHGAQDKVVPLEESSRLIKKLEENGHNDVKLTVYPDAGHDSWTAAYNTPELFEWLLSHKKSNPVD